MCEPYFEAFLASVPDLCSADISLGALEAIEIWLAAIWTYNRRLIILP